MEGLGFELITGAIAIVGTLISGWLAARSAREDRRHEAALAKNERKHAEELALAQTKTDLVSVRETDGVRATYEQGDIIFKQMQEMLTSYDNLNDRYRDRIKELEDSESILRMEVEELRSSIVSASECRIDPSELNSQSDALKERMRQMPWTGGHS